MAARLAEEWFAICGGCEVTILDIGEPLIDVLKQTLEIASDDINMTPKTFTEIAGRKIPIAWSIAIPVRALTIECVSLNAGSWMGTSFPYWEGPISFGDSHTGVGY